MRRVKIEVGRPPSLAPMSLIIESRATLNDGHKMPVLGLGVWQAASGKETRTAVATALQVGYRLIDTAKMYANERDVGAAVRQSGIPRDEIFVTTKLWNSDHGTSPRCERSNGVAASWPSTTSTCT